MAILVAIAVLAVAGFLLFRPDKLFVDDRVDEGLGDAFAAGPTTTVPDATTTTADTVTTTSSAPPTAPDTTSTTAVVDPVRLSVGSFFGIDHTAMGTAAIYEQEGRYVLRFEDDTDIQNGPDLYVWLTPDTEWAAPVSYLDLGKLKGNVGGQNYELPAEFDPEVHRNVLIWCLRFTVPFAAAELG